jgi:hypothetical protein
VNSFAKIAKKYRITATLREKILKKCKLQVAIPHISPALSSDCQISGKRNGAFHWLSPVSERPPHFPLIADEMGKKGRHSMGSERVGDVNEKKAKHSCMPDLPLSYTSKSL